MIIGITGGIGSGKSAVSSYLKKKGYKIVDADKESRNVTKKGSPALKAIAEEFGEDMLDKRGALKRKKLGAVVFTDKAKLERLKEITTGEILKRCLAAIEAEQNKHPGKHIVFDVPLMFESGWNKYCDRVWTVSCKEEIRIGRVVARDGLSEDAVKNRIANQATDSDREAKADFVIRNEGTLEDLYLTIENKLSSI